MTEDYPEWPDNNYPDHIKIGLEIIDILLKKYKLCPHSGIEHLAGTMLLMMDLVVAVEGVDRHRDELNEIWEDRLKKLVKQHYDLMEDMK